MKIYNFPPDPPRYTTEEIVSGLAIAISLLCLGALVIDILLG